jgi:ABC-type antimicrobial peptide transport system permease subunit
VEVYRLAANDLLPQMVVLVRSYGPSDSMTRSLTAIAKSIDPKLFPDVQRMKVSFERKVQLARYTALAVSWLGFVALLLACVGIVGLISYAVRQRTKEIGIRLALGARPSQVLSVVLRQFTYPLVSGLLLGTGAAAALSQILRRELYGVSNLDPAAYLIAVGVLIVMAVLAALLPAARSLRVDPVLALRYD